MCGQRHAEHSRACMHSLLPRISLRQLAGNSLPSGGCGRRLFTGLTISLRSSVRMCCSGARGGPELSAKQERQPKKKGLTEQLCV